MHAVWTNQIVHFLHLNDNTEYNIQCFYPVEVQFDLSLWYCVFISCSHWFFKMFFYKTNLRIFSLLLIKLII